MHLSAVALFDSEGNILHFHGDQTEKRYGASLDKLRGKNLHDFYPPEIAEARIASISKVAETGKAVRESFAVELSTGEHHFEITTVPCGNGDCETAVLSFIRDVTEQEQALTALTARETTERGFRSKLQELHEIVIELAKADSVDEMCRMTVEYGHDRLGFDGVSVFFLPEDDPLAFCGTYAIDHKGRVVDYSHKRNPVLEDATYQLAIQGVEDCYLKIEDADFSPGEHWPAATGYMRAGATMLNSERAFGIVTINNWNRLELITQQQVEIVRLLAAQLGHLIVRKRAEEALLASEQRYRTVVNGIDHPVFILNSDGVFEFANDDLARRLELPLDQIVGSSLWDLFPDTADNSKEFIDRCFTEGGPVEHEIELRTGREKRWYHTRLIPLPGEDEKKCALCISMDVTDRRAADEKLADKNIALRELLDMTEQKGDEIGRQVNANVQGNILPLLRDLEMNIDPKQKEYVDALAKALDDIISPFGARLADECHTLSTTEMKIARMIASGVHTKDIARHQHVEPGTINKQRESIRRKLGLVGKKVSLATHLESLLRGAQADD